jgi:hypothetical protein
MQMIRGLQPFNVHSSVPSGRRAHTLQWLRSVSERSQVRLSSCVSAAKQLMGPATHRRRASVQVGAALMSVREQVEQLSVQRKHQSGTCALSPLLENSNRAIATRIGLIDPRMAHVHGLAVDATDP